MSGWIAVDAGIAVCVLVLTASRTAQLNLNRDARTVVGPIMPAIQCAVLLGLL